MSASRPVSALSALSASSSEVEKPRTRAQTAPKKPNTRKRTTAAAAAAKKPVTRTASRKGSKAKTTTTKKKTTTKVALSRPTWKDMIRECIVENKDDARVGVSRTTIKKFAEERYGVEMSSLNVFQLGRAIASGTETGIFVLPKGPSGKVKLAPKTKENSAPKKPSSGSKRTGKKETR